jgi:deoxyribodipyrimidine photo-lyase
MTSLVWFKRDLRVQDHPALTRAAALGSAVLPLYIVEPEYWQLPDTSGRQWEFIAEAFANLRADLFELGAPLVVRVGRAEEVLDGICRAHGITRIISHEETGNLWTFARDRRVAVWAQSSGIVWDELPQSGVFRPLGDRAAWVARRDAFMGMAALPAPRGLRGHASVEVGAIPTAKEVGISPDNCPLRQIGGRKRGLVLLDSFLTERGETYRTAMSSPISGEQACSRLSPHLAYGTVSAREVGHAVARRRAERPIGLWPSALASFDKRVAGRDYFLQRLEENPAIETRCLHAPAERLRPREADPILLAAWSKGETGLPFVDACIRYLAATGWLNFRMRSMLMAVASYHLWLDWRQTGPVLARAFTDYEPAIHWSQAQMQSGTTGFNTPRIYNPIKQGYDQDPTGAFTRRWCPELARVPDPFLQEPWRWPGANQVVGASYPDPVIDVAASARAAKDAIFGLRKKADPAELSAIASRYKTSPDARFENRKRPRQSVTEPKRQLSFDL